MRYGKIIPVTLVMSMALVACGNSDSENADTSATTGDTAPSTVDTTVSSAPATSTPGTEPSRDSSDAGDLEGSWSADAQDLLDANTANVGSIPMTCDGLVTIGFADGVITQTGDVDCTLTSGGGMSGHAVVDAKGKYSVDGGMLTVSDTVHKTQVSWGGGPASEMVFFGDGTGNYLIDGDTLTINFFDPAVGNISQEWHRS